MRISKRKAHLLVLGAIVLCVILAALFLIRPPPDVTPAIDKAITVFEGEGEPYALLFLDVIYRRFGIQEFADALERYDQVLAGDPPNAPLLRLFRRIADHDNQLQDGDLNFVSSELDVITVPALYCNRFGLPDDYLELLKDSMEDPTKYLVTHVLLAWIWIQENNYDFTLPDGFIEDVYAENAKLINNDQAVFDVELEAAAFLCLAGQASLIDKSFIQRVVDAQDPDGSWGIGEDRWHTTVLGLVYLLHVKYPADSYPPSLAPASQ